MRILNASALYRVLAEKEIRIPKIITINPWLSIVRKLSEEDLSVGNEVLIRPGTEEDLDFLASFEKSNDPGHTTQLQAKKWWYKYGFRCLYIGYLEDECQPFCLNFWIDESDNHRFKNMEYGGLYRKLTSDTAHCDCAYVRTDLRRKGLYFKFCQKRNKLLFQRGKRFVHGHLNVNSKMPMLKNVIRLGYVPDHWISEVRINLPFFKSKAFVHHPLKDTDLKDTDRSKFPLPLFHQDSSS